MGKEEGLGEADFLYPAASQPPRLRGQAATHHITNYKREMAPISPFGLLIPHKYLIRCFNTPVDSSTRKVNVYLRRNFTQPRLYSLDVIGMALLLSLLTLTRWLGAVYGAPLTNWKHNF